MGRFYNDIVKIYSNLNINNAYTFPNADGSNGQVLQTNGSGTVSWVGTSSFGNDNLGNHSATQNLDINTHSIVEVNRIDFRATDGDLGNLQYSTNDRWEFSNGSFYIMNTCPSTYIYSDNIYLGEASGSIIHTRDNQFRTRYIRASGSGGLNFQTDEGTTRMVIEDGGNVGIGTISPTTSLHVNHPSGNSNGFSISNSYDSDRWHYYVYSSNNLYMYFNGSYRGNFNATSGAYTSVSDKKLKTNISEIEPVLEKVKKLSVIDYNFIYQTDGKKYTGLIAQDVEKLFPNLVNQSKINKDRGENEDLYAMDYSGFGVIAIKAIQEQQSQIEEQNIKIENLEKQIQELKDLINNHKNK